MNEVTQKLLDSLRELENSVDPLPYLIDENGRTSIYIDSSKCKLANIVIENANIALITNNGGCDWDAIHFIKNNGYNVFAGKRIALDGLLDV